MLVRWGCKFYFGPDRCSCSAIGIGSWMGVDSTEIVPLNITVVNLARFVLVVKAMVGFYCTARYSATSAIRIIRET